MTNTTTNTTAQTVRPAGTQTRWYDLRPSGNYIPGTGWVDSPAGLYTDHRCPVAGEMAYSLRATGAGYREVREALGFQTDHWTQNAIERHARTHNLEVPRRYTRRATPAELRRFGIELEYNGRGTRYDVTANAQRRGLNVQTVGYGHDIVGYWKNTTDATVTGGELVSPIMSGSAESIEEVLEAIRAIKEAGGSTGRNVGMHVHLDANDFDRDALTRLVDTMQAVEGCLMAYVPTHRWDRSNTYGATRIGDYGWAQLRNAVTGGSLYPASQRTRQARQGGCPVTRYSSVNWNSLLTYGTVEVRLLGHTLNTVKVRVWLEVLTALMRYVRNGGCLNGTATVSEFVEALRTAGLSRSTADRYVQECERRSNGAAAIRPTATVAA